MDLGHLPGPAFTDGELVLSKHEITLDDLRMVVERVGDFGTDNRAGIERTLHRISAIRQPQFDVIGLTCRVGRAVTAPSRSSKISSAASAVSCCWPARRGKTTLLRGPRACAAKSSAMVTCRHQQRDRRRRRHPAPAIGRFRGACRCRTRRSSTR